MTAKRGTKGYVCPKCDFEITTEQDPPLTDCPACGVILERAEIAAADGVLKKVRLSAEREPEQESERGADEAREEDEGLSATARILKRAHAAVRKSPAPPPPEVHADGVYEIVREEPPPSAPPPPARKPATKTTTCTDCGGTVSKRAESCPHCGAPLREKTADHRPNPAPAPEAKKTSLTTWVATFFVVVVMVGAFSGNDGSSGGSSTTCGPTSPECYAERMKIQAGRDCKPKIEEYARYAVEWDDNWIDGPFETYRVMDDGTIHFMGSKVRFQNGFGAWRKQDYSCTWHPDKGVILAHVS